jgi:hypothetical protein
LQEKIAGGRLQEGVEGGRLQEEVGRKVAGGDWTRNLVKERCLTFPEP